MRRRYFEWLLVALIGARMVAGCSAMSPPAPGPPRAASSSAIASSQPSKSTPLDLCRLPDLAPASLVSSPGYTQIAVSVTDPNGTPIRSLKKTDFTVRSGSTLLPIKYFREESTLTTPVSLVTIGDVSESMYRKTVVSERDQLGQVRSTLNQVADQLNECDEAALVMIGGTYPPQIQPPLEAVTLAQPFTTDHSLALEKMYSVMPSGEKRLSDGLRMGLEAVSGAHYPNRAIILMTDGLDQTAIDRSAPVLAQIRDSGVSLWVIGIGDPDAQDSIVTKLRGTTRLDAAAVKKLAAEGGGQLLFAKPVEEDDGASLAAAIITIANQQGDGYTIGIDAPGAAAPTVTLANNSAAQIRVQLVPSQVLAEAAARTAKPKHEVSTEKEVVAPEAIRNQAGYTEMDVTVTKSDGSYVDGLTKSDFRLSVMGAPQPIDFFRAYEESPATVGILVDTSGSMVPKLPQARAAIEQFVNDLSPQDAVFLFAFSSQTYRLQPLTNDHKALIQRLDLLHAYGQTALFDTILAGISEAQPSRNQRKVLLVITDGMDNASSSTADQVVQAAKNSGVLVYSIGIGNPNVSASQEPTVAIGPFIMGGDDIEHVDAVTLSRLAGASGGKSYIIQKVGDGTALNKACLEVADNLHDRHSYVLGFDAQTPPDYAPTIMPISLQVASHRDYSVAAPKWIPAPPPPEQVPATQASSKQ